MRAVSSVLRVSWTSVASGTMSILLPGLLALVRDFQHLGNLFFVLSAIAETVRPFRMRRYLFFKPLPVLRLVLLPHIPLARVIAECCFVHHRDAFFNRTNRFADPAPAACFHIGVIQAVGSDIKARVRAVQPAKRALNAGIEVHHRPHRAGRELLESRIAIGPESPYGMGGRVFKAMAPGNAGDSNAFD